MICNGKHKCKKECTTVVQNITKVKRGKQVSEPKAYGEVYVKTIQNQNSPFFPYLPLINDEPSYYSIPLQGSDPLFILSTQMDSLVGGNTGSVHFGGQFGLFQGDSSLENTTPTGGGIAISLGGDFNASYKITVPDLLLNLTFNPTGVDRDLQGNLTMTSLLAYFDGNSYIIDGSETFLGTRHTEITTVPSGADNIDLFFESQNILSNAFADITQNFSVDTKFYLILLTQFTKNSSNEFVFTGGSIEYDTLKTPSSVTVASLSVTLEKQQQKL